MKDNKKVKILRGIVIIVILVSCLTAWKNFRYGNKQVNKPKMVKETTSIVPVTQSGINVVTDSAIKKNLKEQIDVSEVSELKELYKFTDNYTQTVYNVEDNQEFKLSVKCKDISIEDIEVYTDQSLCEEYKVDANISKDGNTFSIKPKTREMTASNKNSEYIYWGDAQAYYIVCKYDIKSKELKELEEPIVIPFTIKKDINTPVLSYDITDRGKMKLVWNSIENADYYKIYKVSNDGDKKYPVFQAKIKNSETEWSDWLLDGNNGVYKSKNKKVIIMQNAGLNGTYYITACNDNVESRFSNGVDASIVGSKLPVTVSKCVLTNGKTIESTNELPSKVNVENIDGTQNKFDVKYTIDKKTKYKKYVYYKYDVKHTSLSGYIKVKLDRGSKVPDEIDNGLVIDIGDVLNYVSNNTESFDKEYIEYTLEEANEEIKDSKKYNARYKNKINKIDNKIDVEDSKLINLNNHIEFSRDIADRDCNKKEFNRVDCLECSTIYEEYIATKLYNLEDKINIRGFNKLSQVNYMDDVIQKVLYQNPLIYYVDSYKYEVETGDIVIKYRYNKDTILNQREEITDKLKEIREGLNSLSDEDKILKIYNYISSNVKYANKGLESLKKNKYRKIDEKYKEKEYSSVYGAIRGKALGRGYADLFKLCCDNEGIECKVISGYMYKTIPHVWNAVKLNDTWYYIDCVNNKNNTGINKFVYMTSYDTLQSMKYNMSNQFELNDSLDEYLSTDDSKEYYNTHNLIAKDINEYTKILKERLKDGDNPIVVRYTGKDEKYKVISTKIVDVFKEVKLEDRLKSLKFGSGDGYYILWYK